MAKDLRSTVFHMMEQDRKKEKNENEGFGQKDKSSLKKNSKQKEGFQRENLKKEQEVP